MRLADSKDASALAHLGIEGALRELATPRPAAHAARRLDDAEERINASERASITARWEFGRWMLEHVPAGRKRLPNDLLDRISEEIGPDRRELLCRQALAERFRTEDELAVAVDRFGSWDEIVSQVLSYNAGRAAA